MREREIESLLLGAMYNAEDYMWEKDPGTYGEFDLNWPSHLWRHESWTAVHERIARIHEERQR